MSPLTEDRYEEREVDEHGSSEVTEDRAAEQETRSFKITSIIWLITGVIEAIIGIRVLLKLLDANEGSGFVDFIYNISSPFLAPFFGVLGTPEVDGSVFEFSSVVGMVIYLLVAWGIVTLINIVMTPSRSRHVRVSHRH